MFEYYGELHGLVGENCADIERLDFDAKQSINFGQGLRCLS